MGSLESGVLSLEGEDAVEMALMLVQFDLLEKNVPMLQAQVLDLIDAYSALRSVCRSVARCEGKSAAEWRDVAVAHQAALVDTTATMNRYHGDWQKAVALAQDAQARNEELRIANDELRGLTTKNAENTKGAAPSDSEIEVLAQVLDDASSIAYGFKPCWEKVVGDRRSARFAQARAAFAHIGAMVPESVRVDGEKKGRLAAEERVLALEHQLGEERAESSRTIAHLKDQWVEARALLSSNFANERAGLHGQLAELKDEVGRLKDELKAKGEEVLTRPGAPAATDGTDSTDGVVVEGGAA